MSKLIKTNPAYAALAYRRTVLTQVVTHLRRDYIGLDTEPKESLICEEVFQVDSKVPIEEIGYVVEDMSEEIEEIDLEMRKFEFGKREHVNKRRRKQKNQEGAGEQSEEGGEAGGKG